MDSQDQILLIDKPLTWSSFQVVNKVRWMLRQYFKVKKLKVGHAGTLDPLATGLLILATGKNTKKIQDLQGLEKEYTGVIKLGATTPSYDLETEVSDPRSTDHVTAELLEDTLAQFRGDILQKPPIFSAIKKEGKRLYEHARKGEEVEIPARPVVVHEFTVTQFVEDEVHFLIRCSKGTYIRSLAHDLGTALDCGGHLTVLRRTAIGPYRIEDALSVDQLGEQLGVE